MIFCQTRNWIEDVCSITLSSSFFAPVQVCQIWGRHRPHLEKQPDIVGGQRVAMDCHSHSHHTQHELLYWAKTLTPTVLEYSKQLKVTKLFHILLGSRKQTDILRSG